MKKIFQMNCLLLLMVVVFFATSHAQQKPSERSFASVVNQIKQKQATHNQMLRQVKQATPATTLSTSENIQTQQPGTSTSGTTTDQKLQPEERTKQQLFNNKSLNRRPALILKKN